MTGRDSPTHEALLDLLSKAWAHVRAEDSSLGHYITKGGSDEFERAAVHRLAFYLEGLAKAQNWAGFTELVVDVDLARQAGGVPKLGPGESADIVVHQRGLVGPNLLAVECKPEATWLVEETREIDEKKLKRLTRSGPKKSGCPYVLGVRMQLVWSRELRPEDFVRFANGTRLS